MDHIATESRPSNYTNELHAYNGAEQLSVRAHPIDHRRAHALSHGLRTLREGDLPGTHDAKRYLHHKYQRTLRGTISLLQSFRTFLSHSGTAHLETLTREDLEAFIEHLKDLCLQASTVSSRVKQLKAFVRFLIEEGVVHPQVLSRRLMIKVPESLPGAILPEDLRGVLHVIEDIGNRAMIMVLLRTGMRIVLCPRSTGV